VNTFEVATPLEFVVSASVAAAGEVANVPLAPDAGAVKVTDVPSPTAVPSDITVTASGFANSVLTSALCPDPLFTVIVMAGGGGVELELPLLQPARKLMARNIKARMPA
jgi:hypothetical protein